LALAEPKARRDLRNKRKATFRVYVNPAANVTRLVLDSPVRWGL
jgi:hypothetical protein